MLASSLIIIVHEALKEQVCGRLDVPLILVLVIRIETDCIKARFNPIHSYHHRHHFFHQTHQPFQCNRRRWIQWIVSKWREWCKLQFRSMSWDTDPGSHMKKNKIGLYCYTNPVRIHYWFYGLDFWDLLNVGSMLVSWKKRHRRIFQDKVTPLSSLVNWTKSWIFRWGSQAKAFMGNSFLDLEGK